MARKTQNVRAYASPSKYIQGAGVMKDLAFYTDGYGKHVIVIIDGFLFDKLKAEIGQYYSEEHRIEFYKKEGEITESSIREYEEKLKDTKADVFVAVGGGKTIDTVKVLAQTYKKPIIVVPTVASTDAPTSALSVIYKENREHSHEVFLKQNPNIVLVDTKLIAAAPVRFLVSGMGDALATYFEAKANENSNYENVVSAEMGKSFGPTEAAKGIAKLCYEILLRDGVKAKTAAETGMVTEALENIVEVNTLLSGIGFESNGTAAAHSINDGLTVLPGPVKYYHGERVAFGVLCQLIMENAETQMLNEVYRFCLSVGLPVTLSDLGVEDLTEEELYKVVDSAYHNVIHAEPMVVTIENISGAILTADKLGRMYKEGKSL